VSKHSKNKVSDMLLTVESFTAVWFTNISEWDW